MNTERPLKTRKHGGALCISSVIDHVTESRNEISSRVIDFMFVDKLKSLQVNLNIGNWNYSVQFSKNWTWWSMIIIDAFKYIDSNAGSIFLYKILNFDKISSCSAGIKDGLSRKDKPFFLPTYPNFKMAVIGNTHILFWPNHEEE